MCMRLALFSLELTPKASNQTWPIMRLYRLEKRWIFRCAYLSTRFYQASENQAVAIEGSFVYA